MWRIGEPRSSQYMNVNWVGPTIMAYGTPEQKALHLPRISAGNAFWCQGFSEPEAGSDLVSLRTLAIRDGDDYVINGSKIWTSYVNYAEHCFLIVRTDPTSKRHQGISVLLVPMQTPGIEVREIPSVVGDRYFFEVFFSDARVPVSCRLGPENAGLGGRAVRARVRARRRGALRARGGHPRRAGRAGARARPAGRAHGPREARRGARDLRGRRGCSPIA